MPVSSSKNRPTWLRQREIGDARGHNKIKTSYDMMQRLQQEACLMGHNGCVNCLEWNQKGNLLASGSDDRTVIIWDAFRSTKKSVLDVGHEGSIFSVKFMPDFSDSSVASCASDGSVKLTEVSSGKNLLTCSLCHDDRVKRLATHPNQPNLIWSAGEDGYILQFDIRQPHICNATRPTNLLIDLKTGPHIMAKCIAANPVRDEMLAVGSNDIYNRIYDRRYLSQEPDKNACTAYFVPGHLLNSNNRSNHIQSFGTTYLSFSPDGSELLASVHAEQVYLFNVNEPWERYKSFEASLKPILIDRKPSNSKISDIYNLKRRPYSHWSDLKNRFTNSRKIPEEYRVFYNEADEKLLKDLKLSKSMLDELNSLILKIEDCPELYRLRATALINRGWRGDYYQALRDCCSALALGPLDSRTINRLAIIICRLGYRDAANGLLTFIDLMIKEFGDNEDLKSAVNLLKSFKQESDFYIDGTCDTNKYDDNSDSFMMVDDRNSNNSSPTRTSAEFVRQLMAGVELNLNDLEKLTYNNRKEVRRCSNAFDYSKRFCGHCNMNTDIKEASFFGFDGEFIVGGSDDGAFYIWDKESTNIVKAVSADSHILNCAQPHPNICMLATSGIESSVKLWSTLGKACKDVESLEKRCIQNQEYISIDPLEAMVMMLYPERDN